MTKTMNNRYVNENGSTVYVLVHNVGSSYTAEGGLVASRVRTAYESSVRFIELTMLAVSLGIRIRGMDLPWYESFCGV